MVDIYRVTDAVQAPLEGLARSEDDTKAEAQRILEMWGELGKLLRETGVTSENFTDRCDPLRRAGRDPLRHPDRNGASGAASHRPATWSCRDVALTDIELITEPDHCKRLSETLATYTAGLAG